MSAQQQEPADPLDLEIEAFDNMRERLEAEHMDRWVVFADGQFWRGQSFETFQDASRAAREAFGDTEVLIRQVGAVQEIRLPSSLMWIDDIKGIDAEDVAVGR